MAKLTSYEMAEYSMQEFASLRTEILLFNVLAYGAAGLFLTLMVLLSGNPENSRTIVMLGIGFIYSLSLFEYFIHRIGLYLRHAGSDWESCPERNQASWIQVIAKLGAMTPILYLWGEAFGSVPDAAATYFNEAALVLMFTGLALWVIGGMAMRH